MKLTTNPKGDITVMDGNKSLTEAIPILDSNMGTIVAEQGGSFNA